MTAAEGSRPLHVTVAICTWNRRTLLNSTLESLQGVRVPDGTQWELLIVDNASSDGTAELVADWARRSTLPIRYVHEPVTGLSHARNRALREARSCWLLFTDDDVLVDAGWLEAFLQAQQRHPGAGAIGGRVDPWFVEAPDPTVAEAFPALARGFCGIDLGPKESPVPLGTDLVGANFSIRLIPDLPLSFNPNLGVTGTNPLGGEELQYQMELRKAGLEIIWCPEMRVQHYVDPRRMSLAYLRRFHTNVGRHEVILHGVPPGARLGGVPRWLYRLYLAHFTRRVVGSIAGNRLGALRALRQQWQVGGMIAECRSAAKRVR